MQDLPIDHFIQYIAKRGIPERYHALYRKEVTSILLHTSHANIAQLSGDELTKAVSDAEQRWRNRRAVGIALQEYLTLMHHQSVPPQPESDGAADSVAVINPDANDGRHYVRVALNAEVDVDGSRARNRSSDISMGGLYIQTMQAWDVGNRLNVAFKLPQGGPEKIRSAARVVYVDPGVGIGVDFVNIDKLTLRRIRQFVEQCVTSMR